MKLSHIKTVIVLGASMMLISGCRTKLPGEGGHTSTIPPYEMQTWAEEPEPEHVFAKVPVKGYQEDTKELAEYIQSLDNMTADAEKLQFRYPKQVEKLYDFDKFLSPRKSNQEFYDNFCQFMNSYVPDHEVDKNNLTYINNEDGERRSFQENYDKLMKNKEEIFLLLYDNRKGAEPFYAIFESPLGNGLTHFCKGVGAELLGEAISAYGFNIPTVAALETPDSTNSYRLLDGEIRVCDAVKFFEEYLKSIPGIDPAKRISSTKVWKVVVFPLTEGAYGLYYLTTSEIYGVPADYSIGNQGHSQDETYNCDEEIGFGSMVRCNEVDAAYGVYNGYQAINQKPYDEMISAKEALHLVNSKMAKKVEFDVQSVELVYCSLKYTGVIDHPEEGHMPTRAAWKVQMVNPLDGQLYVCYVDAKDGTHFHYYTYSMELIHSLFGKEGSL